MIPSLPALDSSSKINLLWFFSELPGLKSKEYSSEFLIPCGLIKNLYTKDLFSGSIDISLYENIFALLDAGLTVAEDKSSTKASLDLPGGVCSMINLPSCSLTSIVQGFLGFL